VVPDLRRTSVRELAAAIRRRRTSVIDLVEAYLSRCSRFDASLNSFITQTADHARDRARAADVEIRRGNYRGPLHGIPYAVKDIIATRGIRTTNASRVTADWVPDFDATIVRRMNEAGAILLGKLNLREFATGSGVLSGFGVVRNPWAAEFTAAGSSSGSGAAVAARLVPLAVGSDTGGSIRGPAAACGIVGLKPTYGRISLHGVTPLAWTLDHAGPMAVSAEDAAFMLRAMAGRDDLDPASAREPVPDYVGSLARGVRGVKIGLPRRHFTEGAHPDVSRAFGDAIRMFEGLGCTTIEVDIAHAHLAPAAGGLIAMAEAATYHEKRLRDSAAMFDPLVRERLEVAQFYPAVDYIKAQRVRALLIQEVTDVFKGCDVIAVPAYPRLTARHESAATAGSDVKPAGETRTYRASNSYIANMTGMPAMVVPCGFSSGQPALPIALQLYAAPFNESILFRTAHAYQRATDWHTRLPGAVE